jgi:hypothetical protein
MIFCYYAFVKSLDVKVSLSSLTLLLLVAASLLGFSYVMPKAAVASLPIDNNTTTTDDSTRTATPRVDLADEPFAVGHYRSVPTNISETQVQFTFEGNTTITVPNSTETITTRDTGQGNVTFLPGGGANIIRAQIQMTTEDGSESATGDFTEFMKSDESTGIGVGYFSTSSTENLAPLNNTIAVFLDEIQPNEDSVIRFFEWKGDGGGVSIGNDNDTTIGGGSDATTMTTTETAVIPTP